MSGTEWSGSRTPTDVIESYADAWGRGDMEAAFSHYGDDVVIRLPGRGPLAGEHRGKEAVVACIRRLLDSTEGVRVDVLDRATSEERVFLLLREQAERGERSLDIRRVNSYRLRGGKIVEISIFEGDQYAVDEFFSPSSENRHRV